jgi:hypothetical protein
MIILIGTVTIIMSPITTVDSPRTIIVDIIMAIVEAEADFTLAISAEIIRVILLMDIRVTGIRIKDSRTVRMLSNPKCSDGCLNRVSLNLYI